MEKNNKWKKLGAGNLVLDLGKYYISFNDFCVPVMLRIFKSDDNRSETALIKNDKYYILNGDFRKDYEKFKTFKECKKFFDSKKDEFQSNWSN